MKKRSSKALGKRVENEAEMQSAPEGADTSQVFPIVGIGASAGGVEASSTLLSSLPSDLGAAYLFVHHLSPGYESNLAEILQRKTTMPVVRVSDGMRVEPNRVYVIPPNAFMRLDDTILKVESRSKLGSRYHPIDYLFLTLAGVREHLSAGVVLSGADTDGTLGLKAIKEAGGITFAQDGTALHGRMPQHAVEGGYVDYVLPPEGIAAELSSFLKHLSMVATPAHSFLLKDAGIKKILNIILQQKRIDFFSHYKRTTVYRRIMRRMALHKMSTVDKYAEKLAEDPQEIEALYNDFLINVTSFFREPRFYDDLIKIVFPKVESALKPGEPMRIWIAGCATGEEAYSTAICVLEYFNAHKISRPVQIFASDLNIRAIEKARLGVYPKGLIQHISPARLKKFFTRIDGHYQVTKSLREMCVFSQHNLLGDPPFSRIDLISCQNVLIYLEAAPQKKIFQSFHYALKPHGFLLVGKSETITSVSDLFQQYKKDSRLFVKKPGAGRPFSAGEPLTARGGAALAQAPVLRTENDIEKESDKLLLSRYVPAAVLVNKDLDIIRFRGSTSRYLEPASGKASLNLLKMVKDELLFDLRTAMQHAKKSGMPARQQNITLASGPGGSQITIEVNPMKSGRDVYYLVVFTESAEPLPMPEKASRSKREGQAGKIKKLEQALAFAREQLHATSEEFEATREELQSANEEILSSNEELQSINEELETSKEELQSSNEELSTINEELQNRNLELKQARDYVEAIIETMRGPLLVLTPQMRIRSANRAFHQTFKLDKDETEGELIYNLADKQWNIPALRDHMDDMFPGKIEFKDFLINHDFPRIGHRTMIVNAHRLLLHRDEFLILLSFEDITRYKQAEESLREAQERLKLALEAGSVGTWAWNIKTNEFKSSPEQVRLYGLKEGESLRSYADWQKVIHPLDFQKAQDVLKSSVESRKPIDIEFRIVRPDGGTRWILAKARTYYDAAGGPDKVVGVNIDVTERRLAVESLAESERRFHTMSDTAPVMIWMTGPDRQVNFLNRTFLSFTGRDLQEELGDGWLSGIHPDDKESFLQLLNQSFETKQAFKIDYRLRHHEGGYRWVMAQGVPRFTGENGFAGFIGTCVDISDRIDLERQKDDFMGIASHELKTPVTSIKAYAQILLEKFKKAGDELSVNMLTRLDLQIDKLTGLINTLLDVAKVQSGQMDYFDELFGVEPFLQEVVQEMQQTCPDRRILTRVRTKGTVYADKARLAQVLTNLISNALKYSPPDREVIVSVTREGDKYLFSIQDFGEGISKDMQEKIFGRFFRVSESAGNRVSGLGLGLFISSQIVKQQGGSLWVESEPGKGSVFHFSLPIKTE